MGVKAIKLKLAVTVTISIIESPEIVQEVPHFDRIIHEVQVDGERGLCVRQRLGLLPLHINSYYQIIPHRKSKKRNVKKNLIGLELNSALCSEMINTISACYIICYSLSLVKTHFICSSIARCNFTLSFLILSKFAFISFTCECHSEGN